MASRAEASELQTVGGWAIRDDGAGNLIVVSPTGATVGTILGVAASTIQSRTNQAPLAFSYSPPKVAGTYRIIAYLDVTTGTTLTFKNKLTYADPAGSAITDHPIWQLEGSATLVTEPTANTADRFVMLSYLFAVDNSGTAITLVDDSGTYTTCAYRLAIILERLA